MTNPKKSKGASKAVTVPAGSQTTPLPDVAALNLPRVADPDMSHLRHVYCVGEPDISRTRLSNMAIMLMSFIAIVSSMSLIAFNLPAGVLFLLFIGIVAGFAQLFISAREYDRTGGWFIVDETGFRYGLGAEKDGGPEVKETCVAWQEIARAPNGAQDVVFYANYNSRGPNLLMLRFWQRTPSGEIALRDLLFQGCVPPEYRSLCRFRNSRDLLKAILYGLAAHCDGLRFDPNVFVHAAIDPRTWLPMPRPLREVKERTAAFVAVIFLWVFGWIGMLIIFTDGLSSHAFVFSFLILTIIVTGIPVGSKFDRWSNAQWKRRHPYLADTIIFTREEKGSGKGKTSEEKL